MVWVGEKVTSSRSLSRWTAPNLSIQKRVKSSNRRGCDSFRFSYILHHSRLTGFRACSTKSEFSCEAGKPVDKKLIENGATSQFSYIVNFFPVALLNPQWLIIEKLRTPKKQTVSFNSYWLVKASVFSWNKPGAWKPWCLGVLLITNKQGLKGRLLNCHSLFLYT